MAHRRTASCDWQWPLRALVAAGLLTVCCRAAMSDRPHSNATLHLRLVGDIMVHASELAAARLDGEEEYRFESFFESIQPWLQDADFTLGNLETTLIEQKFTGYPCFGSPERLARALAWAGFDVLLTANNHALDKLEPGVRNTLDVLDAYGLRHTGTARSPTEAAVPLILEHDGIRLAVLAYTEMTNGLEQCIEKEKLAYMVNYAEEDRIIRDIEKVRASGADVVLVFLHWGDEYQRRPAKRQVALGEALVAAGADLVVGCHPHVAQPAVWRVVRDDSGRERRALVAYSLGNFISSQRDRYKDAGAILDIRIEKAPDGRRARLVSAELIPTWIQICRVAGKTDYRVLAAQAVAIEWPLGLEPLVQQSDYRRAVQSISDLEQLLASAGPGALPLAATPAPYGRPRFFSDVNGWFSCSDPLLEAAWDFAGSANPSRFKPDQNTDRKSRVQNDEAERPTPRQVAFLAERGAANPVSWDPRQILLREMFGLDASGAEWTTLSFAPRVPPAIEHASLTLPVEGASVTTRYVRAKGFEVILPRGSQFRTQETRRKVPIVVSWLPSGAIRPLTPDETAWLARYGWRRAVGGNTAVWLSIDEQYVRFVQEEFILWEARCSTPCLPPSAKAIDSMAPVGWHIVKDRIGADTPLGDEIHSSRQRGQGTTDTAKQDGERIFTRLITLQGLDGDAHPCPCTQVRESCHFHGTSDEASLGAPVAQSGVRLSNSDVWCLHDMTHKGMLMLATDFPDHVAPR